MEDSVISKNKDYPENYAAAATGQKASKDSKKKGVKLLYLLAVFLAVVAAAAFMGVYSLYQHQLMPVSASEEESYITIESGMSSADVASTLYEEGLIRSPLAFRLYARQSNVSDKMQAGFYGLSPSQSVPEILEVIADGQVADKVLRIPSGSQLEDVESVLSEAGFSQSEIESGLNAEYQSEILRDKPGDATLEGYLFPDTYHIAADSTVTDIVEMVLANTERHIDEQVVEGWQEQGLDIHRGLTLASIVQKESPIDDMPAIAGVFVNRLEEGRKLESDATVNYALGTSKLQPTSEDISVNHPYNTYEINGLPPGPINNPESAAIKATATPEEHDWLFFLHKPSGETVFSHTFDEHIENRRRFLD